MGPLLTVLIREVSLLQSVHGNGLGYLHVTKSMHIGLSLLYHTCISYSSEDQKGHVYIY